MEGHGPLSFTFLWVLGFEFFSYWIVKIDSCGEREREDKL